MELEIPTRPQISIFIVWRGDIIIYIYIYLVTLCCLQALTVHPVVRMPQLVLHGQVALDQMSFDCKTSAGIPAKKSCLGVKQVSFEF